MSVVAKDPEGERTTKFARSMRRSRAADTRARAHGIVAFALLLALVTGACNTGLPGGSDADAADQLAALVDEVWDRQIEHNPFVRIREGLPVGELPPFSYDDAEADAIHAQSVLDRLDAIDTAQLEHEDVLTAEILRWQASMQVEGLQYYWLQSLLTPYVNPLPGLQRIFAAQPLNDRQDLDNYLRLLEQVSPWVRSLYETVRSQAARGYVISRANMPAVIAVTRAAIKPAVNHPLAPAGDKLSAVAAEDAQAFELEFGDIIEREINPAIEELAEYLEGEYLDLAPEGVGVRQYPNGDNYYRYLTRLTTTMDVTPEQVQQVGFDMVEQMQQEMAAIQTEIGFEGTAAEFREYLRDDARFYPQTPDEVGERLLSAADRFYARIDDYFLAVPEAPYGVRRLDPALEGSQTYGYYSPPTPADPTGYYNCTDSLARIAFDHRDLRVT